MNRGLTYRRRGFQWFGKRITQDQIERAQRLREKLHLPITEMAKQAFEDYLNEQELVLQQIDDYEAGKLTSPKP